MKCRRKACASNNRNFELYILVRASLFVPARASSSTRKHYLHNNLGLSTTIFLRREISYATSVSEISLKRVVRRISVT